MSAGSKKSNTGILADTRMSGTGGTQASDNWGVLPADLHEWAVYKDELGQTRRIFEDIAKNEPLPGKALRQLDHAFDLSIYNPQEPKTPKQQEMLNAKRTTLFEALANTDFNRHLDATQQWNDAPEFDYNGNKFPKSMGPKLFGAEQQSWIDNNRPMHAGERAQTAKKLQADFMKATPLDELGQKTPPIEIAQASSDANAAAYQMLERSATARSQINTKNPDTSHNMKPQQEFRWGEQLHGKKSNLLPKKVDRFPAKDAYQHWLLGEGQPVEVPLNSIDLSDFDITKIDSFKNTLKKGPGVYKIKITDAIVDINSNLSDEATFGRIGINTEGNLRIHPDGKTWEYWGDAIGAPNANLNGKSGDFFDFNPDNRTWYKELPTRAIHQLPGTSYPIYFTGKSRLYRKGEIDE